MGSRPAVTSPPLARPDARPAEAGRRTGTDDRAASAGPTATPVRGPAKTGDPAKTGRSAGRRSRRSLKKRRVRIVAGAGALAVLGVAGVLVTQMMTGGGAAHAITTPAKVLSYTQAPGLAQSLGAPQLRAEIVQKGNGEARNVVDAVYEDSTGPAAKSGPVIILFIGGNLSGSASSFISGFTGLLPTAFVTRAGALGGQAACVPGVNGHPAECAWADNDTFGLFASPGLDASQLAAQLRQIRPLVEHVVKK
jgi:hypothetical protein